MVPCWGSYMRGRSCATVDLPDPEPPTINVVSCAAKYMSTSWSTGSSGRDGYANVTLESVSSPAHFVGRIPRRGVGIDGELTMKGARSFLGVWGVVTGAGAGVGCSMRQTRA